MYINETFINSKYSLCYKEKFKLSTDTRTKDSKVPYMKNVIKVSILGASLNVFFFKLTLTWLTVCYSLYFAD